jgi:hypothetical protein
MTPHAYRAFTAALTANLTERPAALGLVALGSMAERDYPPDRWSDHDFFVIVDEGHDASFRDDLSWLPDLDEVVLAVRETAHGFKAIYRHGHLIEFAVFTLEQLEIARVNRYRVLLDRVDLEARMVRLQRAGTVFVAENTQSDEARIGQLLGLLLAGAGRYRRGERISGSRFVHSYALDHLLTLLIRHLPTEAESKGLLDAFDPTRRFERCYPSLGATLAGLAGLPAPAAALAMLDLTERELAGRLEDYPWEASGVVRAQLDADRRSLRS